MDKTFLTLEWERWLSHNQTFINFITVIMLSPTKTWSTTHQNVSTPQSSQVLGGATTLFGVFVLALPVPIILNTCDNTSTSISARSQQLSWIFHFSIVLWNQTLWRFAWNYKNRVWKNEVSVNDIAVIARRLVVTIINLPLVVLSVSWCFYFRWTTRRQRGWRWRTELPAVKGAANLHSFPSDRSSVLLFLWNVSTLTSGISNLAGSAFNNSGRNHVAVAPRLISF